MAVGFKYLQPEVVSALSGDPECHAEQRINQKGRRIRKVHLTEPESR